MTKHIPATAGVKRATKVFFIFFEKSIDRKKNGVFKAHKRKQKMKNKMKKKATHSIDLSLSFTNVQQNKKKKNWIKKSLILAQKRGFLNRHVRDNFDVRAK